MVLPINHLKKHFDRSAICSGGKQAQVQQASNTGFYKWALHYRIKATHGVKHE